MVYYIHETSPPYDLCVLQIYTTKTGW